jgi:hypothetical protein
MTKIFYPKYFLFGILLGFMLCCFTGYFVSNKPMFENFKRFFLPIEPQTLYYPTARELLTTARNEVSKDKILVLLGGSSIFRGAGQDANELWSDQLQRLLGDKYKVINYATDGASFSSFGGVVYRMLRKEYPKIIFVIATYPFNSQGEMDGLDPYSYLFWDAYYKRLFEPDIKETELINQLRKRQIKTAAGIEQHVMNYLDSLFYFRDLWNWVGYHLIFTTWNEFEFQKPFRPRHVYQDDPVSPAYKKVLAEANKDQEHLQQGLKAVDYIVSNYIEDLSKENPQVKETVKIAGHQAYNDIFQPGDRAKILCVQTTYNSSIIKASSKNIQKGYLAMFNQAHVMMQSLGYTVIDVGNDFTVEDYYDFSHFTGSGGKKMAKMVAKKIEAMSVLNKYT